MADVQRDVVTILEDIASNVGGGGGGGTATAAKQDTGNASLASIDTKTSAQATAAKQDTAQTSLSAIVVSAAASATAAKQDTLATAVGSTNTKLDTTIAGLASIDGHVDGLEASASSIDTKLSSQATAAKQDTLATAVGSTNTKLDTLHADVDGLETLGAAHSTKLDTINTTLGTIDGHVDGIETLIGSTNTKLDTVNTTNQKLTPLGPGEPTATPSTSLLFNIAFTAAGTQSIDLSGANYVGLKAALDAGKVLVLSCTADLWINWAANSVTIAATATAAVTPATQGFFKAGGAEWTERGRASITRLNILGGATAGVLCVAIAE